jgi:hypothetical protein
MQPSKNIQMQREFIYKFSLKIWVIIIYLLLMILSNTLLFLNHVQETYQFFQISWIRLNFKLPSSFKNVISPEIQLPLNVQKFRALVKINETIKFQI